MSSISRIGLIALLSALVVGGASWACASWQPAEAVASEPPASCPIPLGAWSYDSVVREEQTRYVVKRMLMERLARDTEDAVLAAVRVWALYYEVDEEYALCVAHRESSMDQAAVGDDGNAVGLWQFWLPTWEIFRKKMDVATDDMRNDLQESTRTAMWAFANGYARHWAPVKKGLCEAPKTTQTTTP